MFVFVFVFSRRALHAATASLFQLVRRFPMVTFHQQTQRFAVGCTDGLIVLYDLRTATKWKVLEGHTSKRRRDREVDLLLLLAVLLSLLSFIPFSLLFFRSVCGCISSRI